MCHLGVHTSRSQSQECLQRRDTHQRHLCAVVPSCEDTNCFGRSSQITKKTFFFFWNFPFFFSRTEQLKREWKVEHTCWKKLVQGKHDSVCSDDLSQVFPNRGQHSAGTTLVGAGRNRGEALGVRGGTDRKIDCILSAALFSSVPSSQLCKRQPDVSFRPTSYQRLTRRIHTTPLDIYDSVKVIFPTRFSQMCLLFMDIRARGGDDVTHSRFLSAVTVCIVGHGGSLFLFEGC